MKDHFRENFNEDSNGGTADAGGCVFCKIVRGELPSAKIYEDERFVVILDRFPAAPGHALIVPKNHAKTIFDLDDEDAAELFSLIKRTAKTINDALNPDGINVLQNNGEAAGQSVGHTHVHVIPRFAGDAVNISWSVIERPQDAFDALTARLSVARGAEL